MGKVIPTLTKTTYITKLLPQNCPKTTSKLPQNFWICSDPPPPLAVLRQKKVLRALEHLKHGVEHGQHDHLALHQLASVQGRSLRISDYLSCRVL